MMDTREIYFDNSATTRCSREVCDAVMDAMRENYGNPSSRHLKGVEAERILRQAREEIASTLRCSEKEIFFTSGGTESDNWAVIGGASANKRSGMHLITTAVEHPAVLQPMQYLAEQGYTVTHLPVDASCKISLEDLEKALDDQTILVSIMMINNEIGAEEPVAEAVKIIRQIRPSALVHVDAVQAYGKLPINVKKLGVDMLSMSGHKIHGPKGTGFLYVKEKTKLHPFILGGGQQKGMRSGTDNVPGAAGLAAACRIACTNLEANAAVMRSLKNHLVRGLKELDQVVVHSPEGAEGAPHIVSAAFVGVRSEVLLHALEDRGIYVSAGSACSSNKKLPVSPVLKEMGLPKEEQESTLRFSFSEENTIEEVDECLQALREFLPVLRKYTRK